MIAPAILGAVLGFWLRGLESRKIEIIARIEEACKEIESLRIVGGKYWSRDTNLLVQDSESIEQEGEILGRLHSLNLTVTTLTEYLPKDFSQDLKAELRELRQNTTSTPFASTTGHSQSAAAVNSCHQAGASLANTLRQAGRAYNRKWVGFSRRVY